MQPTDTELMRAGKKAPPKPSRYWCAAGNGASPGCWDDWLAPTTPPTCARTCFCRIYQAGPAYRQREGAFTTWLYRIVLNVARDAGGRSRRALAPLADHEPPGNENPDDDVCRRELAQLVAEAIAELPDPQREVLVLRPCEGCRSEKLRLTGTPASALKSTSPRL